LGDWHLGRDPSAYWAISSHQAPKQVHIWTLECLQWEAKQRSGTGQELRIWQGLEGRRASQWVTKVSGQRGCKATVRFSFFGSSWSLPGTWQSQVLYPAQPWKTSHFMTTLDLSSIPRELKNTRKLELGAPGSERHLIKSLILPSLFKDIIAALLNRCC
jgi:hypothetical protein